MSALDIGVDSKVYLGGMSQLTVSKLADRVGTSTDTLRYYERIGLMPEPDRNPSGYRVYDEDAVGRVQFIKRAQRLGLRLEEIADLLDIRERGLCPCGHTRGLLERRMTQLDEEIAAMTGLRRDIQEMLEELPAAQSQTWTCGSDLLQIQKSPPTGGGATTEGEGVSE